MPNNETFAHRAAHKKPRAFLNALIDLHLDREVHGPLYNQLAKAEGEEKCIHRAVFLMAVLLMLSVAGLGYCALLLPRVFHNPDHLLMRSLFVLGLGALISQVGFLGYLVWHRAIVMTRLHEECRLRVLSLAQSKLEPPAAPNLAVPAETNDSRVFPKTPKPQPELTPPAPLGQEGFCRSS
jgi:hypothetical protein